MPCKAENAGRLSPAKDDNTAGYEKGGLVAYVVRIPDASLLSVGLAFGQGSPMYEKLQIPDGFRFVSAAAFGYTNGQAAPKELSLRLAINTLK